HADFLTRLAVSVVTWTSPDGGAHYCAVRGGALTVRAGKVAIATREAVAGDDLDTLDREVLARFRADLDEERVEHVETTRLQLNVMRQMLARLQPKPKGAGQ
ncbi:MAG: F0F1 ATP synthase subunit epsilon, partial [Paracoccaceae bacterium]|nr:F0F1 ATP synthase subunit epsilon [Paracoccaceae bacterium]